MSADIETMLAAALHQIAPDIDVSTIDRDGDLREEFDIDSMDFLNLVTVLSAQLSATLPESDYSKMTSFNAMRTYLESVNR